MISFSRRSDWDLTPNPLSALLAEKKARGAVITDLTVSNPTRVGLSYDGSAILNSFERPDNLDYAPDPKGLPAARKAVCEYYRKRKADVSPEDLFLTAGTSEAYSLLFKLLGNPGDEILIPRPGYPLLSYLAALESLVPVAYPLRYDETSGWRTDLELVDALINDKTCAVAGVSPGNPVGAYVKADELKQLSRIAADRGAALIMDEVFFDFPGADAPEDLFTSARLQEGLCFTLNGFSKILGLPQMKLSWIALSGDRRFTAPASERLEFISDFYLSVSTPVQQAAPELMRLGTSVRHQISERIGANMGILGETVGNVSDIRMLKREGGWYGVLDIADRLSDEERMLTLLKERNTLVHPGGFYGFDRDGYAVMSLLTPSESFAEGVEALVSLFRF